MTSGALSSGGPGRSVVGNGITSKTSGAVGPACPDPIEQFDPPKTRVKPLITPHVVDWLIVTLSLVTAGDGAPVIPANALTTGPSAPTVPFAAPVSVNVTAL